MDTVYPVLSGESDGPCGHRPASEQPPQIQPRRHLKPAEDDIADWNNNYGQQHIALSGGRQHLAQKVGVTLQWELENVDPITDLTGKLHPAVCKNAPLDTSNAQNN